MSRQRGSIRVRARTAARRGAGTSIASLRLLISPRNPLTEAQTTGHVGQTMSNPQPFSPTKKSDFRRSALVQGAGRLSPRALERMTVATTARHAAVMSKVADTYFAGSAYDRVDYDSLDEDTVEMVLSPEDMQLLSRAAEQALAEVRATRAAAATPIATRAPVEKVSGAAKAAAASEERASAESRGTESVAESSGTTKSQASSAIETAGAVKTTDSVETSGAAKATLTTATSGAAKAALSTTATSGAAKAALSTTATSGAAKIPSGAVQISDPVRTPGTAKPSPTATHGSRWSPARIVGMISVVAATAIALASMTHHTSHAADLAPGPVPTSAHAQTLTMAQAPTPAPASHVATPVLAGKAPVEAAGAPNPDATANPAATRNPPAAPSRIAALSPVTSAATAARPVATRASVATPSSTVAPSAPAPEPVRMKNPFDRSEVFEFPPGTSLEDARQSVAELLLQRARTRSIQLSYTTHADSTYEAR
jgi:hypothetical protein